MLKPVQFWGHLVVKYGQATIMRTNLPGRPEGHRSSQGVSLGQAVSCNRDQRRIPQNETGSVEHGFYHQPTFSQVPKSTTQ
ncbi:hypothetical protein ElyMa_006474200 [Elysia marginata]|uniref:Uncharacterized protein n=1 Tax=Elysia marginata TaxID=1093978 RepID=A0AAV4HZB5_9GAST|nr:hypothetical protein ElyMa_006474200 [Elysia marginata]